MTEWVLLNHTLAREMIGRATLVTPSRNIQPWRFVARLLMTTTETNTAIDSLIAGKALQRVLLSAASEGLQASYVNQAIQIQSTRPKSRNFCCRGMLPAGYVSTGLSRARCRRSAMKRRRGHAAVDCAIGITSPLFERSHA
jgi:hypothetical protein